MRLNIINILLKLFHKSKRIQMAEGRQLSHNILLYSRI